MLRKLAYLLVCLAALALCGPVGQSEEKESALDEKLAKYEKVDSIEGDITIITSDTLSNLMTFWVEEFRKNYPKIRCTVEGKGATTPPRALLDGFAGIGGMSRPYKDSELAEFEKKYGYNPSYIVVAYDASAVFVHKDNPVEKLSLAQVDAIFSTTRKREHEQDITKWGQVSLDGDWAEREIALFGRNSTSGPYGYFKDAALSKGDFKKTLKELPGGATVVHEVGQNLGGIGYSGTGAKTDAVRAVPLSAETGGEAFDATAQNCYDETYPLSRKLYIYFNRKPGENLKPHIREFLKFVHSKQGQEVVIKDGFIPLTQARVDDTKAAYEDK